jgi:hypothetical protein
MTEPAADEGERHVPFDDRTRSDDPEVNGVLDSGDDIAVCRDGVRDNRGRRQKKRPDRKQR